jgi:NADH-quinone oxidoreductase subunit M
MLHAGVLMKLGAYGILRIGMELLPEGAQFWMPALIVLGTINVVYGAVSAMAQRDLKYVIGYSSVSHMGYVIMGLATLDQLGVNGAVLQMFSHGIMTALFFVLVGAIYDRTHLRDIDVLEGLAKRMGTTASLFAVAGLASLGLPGLSGFVAELLVFIGAFRTYPIVGVLGVFAAALTAVYILRLMAKVFFGPISERWQGLTDISRTETASALLLVAFIVVIGVWPFPWIDLIDPSIGSLLGRMG